MSDNQPEIDNLGITAISVTFEEGTVKNISTGAAIGFEEEAVYVYSKGMNLVDLYAAIVSLVTAFDETSPISFMDSYKLLHQKEEEQ